jgi:hypothetical protein
MKIIYALTDVQLEGIKKIHIWLKGFEPNDEMRVSNQIKSAFQLQVMVEKIIHLQQYTPDEQTVLNELRSYTIGKKNVEFI